MIQFLAAAALLAGTVVPVAADDPPPPGRLTANLITVNGSGCPAGASSVVVQEDKLGVSLRHDPPLLAVPSSPTTTNCHLVIKLNIPADYAFAIQPITHHGSAQLPKGATARLSSHAWLPGMADTMTTHRFAGPYDQQFEVTDRHDPAAPVYGPCGGSQFTAKFELSVQAPAGSTARLQLGVEDFDRSTDYHLRWKKCR
ncbi:DUF4360 domain-containing protein [Pseudonocardiaceae bacterium YIM PH 21723]|nr:DUF4360 domain-containing protein [Pseudonocardiaceae bacterium YIM PH 21723]